LVILMPSLHRLTIDETHPLLCFDSKPIFKQIRILTLTSMTDPKTTASPVDVSNLCRVFPHIEHLTMRINSFQDMTNAINGLKHLSSVIFDMRYFCDISSLFNLTDQWLVSNTQPQRMLNKNNYTFRFSLDPNIFLWIS
jgi:hypothetical protein